MRRAEISRLARELVLLPAFRAAALRIRQTFGGRQA